MLTEQWKKAVDEGEYVGQLSTDMSKAFDCMYHSLLLAKLKTYNFDEQSLKLMKSYFTNCYNRVKLGNTTISWKYAVDRGCPQGSSFGPLLWNLYQNDLTYITKSKISMFVDDHQPYVTHKNVGVIQQKLQNSAETATDWYDANYLQGNFSKYGSILIGKGKLDATLNINIKVFAITPHQVIKLLGVNLDCRLTFANHISQIGRKASQKGGVIMRLRNLIPTNAKVELYKALILPHMIY